MNRLLDTCSQGCLKMPGEPLYASTPILYKIIFIRFEQAPVCAGTFEYIGLDQSFWTWHCRHLGPDDSSLSGLFCAWQDVRPCPWPLPTTCQEQPSPISILWQPNVSPNISKRPPLEDEINSAEKFSFRIILTTLHILVQLCSKVGERWMMHQELWNLLCFCHLWWLQLLPQSHQKTATLNGHVCTLCSVLPMRILSLSQSLTTDDNQSQ